MLIAIIVLIFLAVIGFFAYGIYMVFFYKTTAEKVEGIDNQEKLIKIAKNDSDYNARIKSVRKINDESVLVEIAKNDSSSSVRRVAVEKIYNQDVLIDIARNDSDKFVRREAIEKINNQDVLIDIARNDEDPSVRINAVERIDDKDTLIDIVKNDPYRIKGKTKTIEWKNELYEAYARETYFRYTYPVRKAANEKLGNQYGQYCEEKVTQEYKYL